MRVSVVVPTLNEAARIVATLAPLQPLRAAGHEVIVADGGSTDATLALAAPLADRAFVASRGRASQMNAGAALATGDILLFLHADSRLPDGGVDLVSREMARSGRRWGRFDVTIAGRHRVLAVVAAAMNLSLAPHRHRHRRPGIFVERALFDAIGGFPDQPLMEDIELSKRLKRAGEPPLCLRERVVTSGRRWERNGPWRTIVAMWRWRLAYWRAADVSRLAAEYHAKSGAAPVTLQVFAKNPTPGNVKTRLGAAIGDDEAAALYARFVDMALATAVAARAAGLVDRVELWCAPDASAPAFASWRDRYQVELRRQPDARSRRANAHRAGRRARSRLARDPRSARIVRCSISPIWREAVAALDTHDAVFGPAEDGGYVLIGLARRVDAFSGVRWSTPDVMRATRELLEGQRVAWKELPTLWDVDGPSDLARWENHTAHPSASREAFRTESC